MTCPVCGKQESALFVPYYSCCEGLCHGCWQWASTYVTQLVRFYADRYQALTK